MKNTVVSRLITGAMLIALASGCASKGFVRHQVKDANDQLSAQVDTKIQKVETNVAELSDQVGETTRITKENTTQISNNAAKITDTSNQLQTAKAEIKGDIKVVDDKAGGAMSSAEKANVAAGDAGKRVDGLANKFENRNNYAVAAEDSVRFGFNSAKLQAEFQPVLDSVAEKLKHDPDAVIVLEGRTDSTGDEDYNIKLGQQRLDAVLRYLVVKSDVPINRIFQVSLGKEKPVADNKTKEGREQNRATVIRLLSPRANGAVASK